LDKDAPVSRPVQRIGVVRSLAILGGLHHHYARAQVFGTHRARGGDSGTGWARTIRRTQFSHSLVLASLGDPNIFGIY
jgi:hypothetical protein